MRGGREGKRGETEREGRRGTGQGKGERKVERKGKGRMNVCIYKNIDGKRYSKREKIDFRTFTCRFIYI